MTHYAFGVKGYHALEDGFLKRAIRENTGVYNTGLAGPDLFFYSAVEVLRSGMTVGRAMHKYRTGAFLDNLLDEALALTGKDRETAMAYYTGFVGHYCLDSKAHALVYRVCHHPSSAVALGKHFRYEAAMDAMCCRKILGRDINRSHQMGLNRLTCRQKLVIARILSASIQKTYGGEIRCPSVSRMLLILEEYRIICGLLIDPSGFREWCYLHLELFKRGYPHNSPLFINNNLYGLREAEWNRFYSCFREGEAVYRPCINMIGSVAETPHSDRLRTNLTELIGSRSYHGFYHYDAACDLPLDELIRRQREREKHYH